MPYIPDDARWYIAEVILEHRVEDDPRNVVHVNLNLIEAASPDEAYDKAIALGRDGESVYENAAGGMVRVVFRGLRDLFVIYEDLEDGAEILYEKKVCVLEDQLRTMVKERDALAVFAPMEDWTKSDDPELLSDDVAKLLLKHFEGHPADPA
jgi:Domain of unknown function (DUF4288)